MSTVGEVLALPGNNVCADCQVRPAKWASTNLGIFLCIECSGAHRSLGTHISFVRSCTLDTWSPEQVRVMACVGNRRANAYWEARLPPQFVRPSPTGSYQLRNFIFQKYAQSRWAAPGPRPSDPAVIAPPDPPAPARRRRRRTATRAQDRGRSSIVAAAAVQRDRSAEPHAPQIRPGQATDRVSSAARKPGTKLPERLARKARVRAPPIAVESPRRMPPSIASAPVLTACAQDDDEYDPFA
jgi:stromal membrane-associated protein